MEYILHLLILSCIYIILSQSLNLVAGYGGMMSLAHAVFYGIGAYTTAFLSVNYNIQPILTIPIAVLLSGLLALCISMVAVRTIDDYFIICTMGVQVTFSAILNNCVEITNGPLGIIGIPNMCLGRVVFDNKWCYLCVSLCIVLIGYLLLIKISTSAFGRTLRALNEDEIFTQALGKNIYLTKTIAFTISAMYAATAGVLYAHYISYIDPSSFSMDESIFILSIVIIGGMQNYKGSAIAAFVLIIIPESLRFIGLPLSTSANLRQILYGVALIIMMLKPNIKRGQKTR